LFQAQNQKPDQKPDVEAVISDVQQMSLDSIDMSHTVAGYDFTPDPNLQPGNFIDPTALRDPVVHYNDIQDAGLEYNPFFDVNFTNGQNAGAYNPLDAGVGFPATIDTTMWSQLSPNETPSFETDFSDLIVFP